MGGHIKQAKGWTVDLDDAALTIHLEMLPDHAFYFFGKSPGAGGLPSGTSGRLTCLVSGGIDSPVAAYRMMRRGCTVSFVHFHSYPILSRASQEKVREIVTLLTQYQQHARVAMVAFGELQQQVVLAVPPQYRVVIYRRLMLRIAERLALKWKSRALVTGEVVGQVASQTLENMTAIAEACSLEILRPLVGMDKDEISEEAEAHRYACHFEHPGPGLLHALHAAPSGDACPAGRRPARRRGAARSTRWWPGRWRRRPSRSSAFPCRARSCDAAFPRFR